MGFSKVDRGTSERWSKKSAKVFKELKLKSLWEKEASFVWDTLLNQAQMLTHLVWRAYSSRLERTQCSSDHISNALLWKKDFNLMGKRWRNIDRVVQVNVEPNKETLAFLWLPSSSLAIKQLHHVLQGMEFAKYGINVSSFSFDTYSE